MKSAHALAAGLLFKFCAPVSAITLDQPFELVHLGTLPSAAVQSSALSVAADGSVIVGFSHTDAGDRAVLWRSGTIEPLAGFPPGTTFSIAHGTSADGAIVVGQCQVNDALRAFRWQAGRVTLLDSPAGEIAEAWAVSADGQTIAGAIRGNGTDRAVAWQNEKCVDLAESGRPGAAYAISADGRTAGGIWQNADLGRAARFRAGKLEDLGGLRRAGSGSATAFGISADGDVIVGECESSYGTEAFRWTGGKLQGLGCLSPSHDFLSSARAVSADGNVIVGSSARDDGSMGAFVWDPLHGLRWLEDILVRSGNLRLGLWTLREATGISADGCTIVGTGRDLRGRNEAWLARVPAGVWKNNRKKDVKGAAEQALSFDRHEHTITGVNSPGGIALSDERVFVTDTFYDCIRVFGLDGWPLATWYGPALDHLRAPQGLALGRNGDVLVADTGNRRICVLDNRGNLRRAFGRHGAGKLVRPVAIVADDEQFYVADEGPDCVQVYDQRGQFLRSIGGPSGDALRQPRDIALSPTGRLYIADCGDDRMAMCDRDGGHFAASGAHGEQPGFFVQPTGVRFFRNQIFVVDRGNQRVQIFTPDGEFVSAWGPRALRPHAGDGQLHLPEQLAISPSGKFALISEPLEDRCQLFSLTADAPEFDPAMPVFDAVHDFNPWGGIACSGSIVAVPLADRGGVAIFRLTKDGAMLVTRIGISGGAFGQFRGPTAVALADDGARLLALDTGNQRLQTFSLPPELLAAASEQMGGWRFVQSLDIAPLRASVMAYHYSMPLLLADESSRRVFETDSAPLTGGIAKTPRWSPPDSLVAFAYNRFGDRLYVIDAARRHILAFDERGKRTAEWAKFGVGAVEFLAPAGIAIDSNSAVYVTDAGTNLVQKFDPAGHLLTTWGGSGIDAGQFCHPAGIAVAGDGRVVVVDVGNHRCQVFSPTGQFLGVFGSELYSFPAKLP